MLVQLLSIFLVPLVTQPHKIVICTKRKGILIFISYNIAEKRLKQALSSSRLLWLEISTLLKLEISSFIKKHFWDQLKFCIFALVGLKS